MADVDKTPGETNPAFLNDDNNTTAIAKATEAGDSSSASPTTAVQKKELTEEEKIEKFRILKNVVIISIAFMFLFTSFNSMANLQSSINKVEGTAALSTLYAALVVSCAFLPTWMIKKFKAKWTLCFSMLCYSTYIAAQFYPTVWTLVPTSIILGLGAAPMWSAKCTYLTQVGGKYAEIVGENAEVVIVRFFGIFFLFFQSTQVWGNLISSSVLSQGVANEEEIDELALLSCGVNFCPHIASSETTNITNLAKPPISKIYTMASIYLVCAIISSVIIAALVDPLTRFGENERMGSSTGKSGWELLVATFNHMRHPYQLLIIPLTMWSGVEQAFLGADYTAAYVSCGLGVHMVGYVMICYGVCDAICSITFSPLVKMVGRVPIFTMGAIINLGIAIALRSWTPHPDDVVLFFVMAGLWGVSDAVWQTQINAFYGVIFPGESEAAFSNYRLWESLGYIFSYVGSATYCMDVKITNVVVSLVFGIIGYYAIEVLERRGGLKKDDKNNVLTIDRLIKDKFFGGKN
ncbi:UNC93-like protein isoform X3 [Homarus americanus]|uniref:UNC93-like protein isoform X2 n=1 Tax=Homarus americanus TaxID=6706 RepID=UPI001C490190|nr:UNC93-like protein isoform X2 [Homarus americanus]XP_042205188.1 UNC93-like protein isoform X3 [Homarus americanus]